MRTFELASRFASRRWLPRSRPWRGTERGAAIFVVILVLTILTAIGVFAARAAGLNQRMSGYSRQSTQTAYVTEYGMTTVIDTLFGPRGQAFKDEIVAARDPCRAMQFLDAGPGQAACKRVFMNEVQSDLANEGTNAVLFDPDGGSLGSVENPLNPDFVVELTDLYRERSIPGFDQGGTGPELKFFQVTVTGTGQIRPIAPTGDPEAGVCISAAERASAQVSGMRTFRAVVQVGAF